MLSLELQRQERRKELLKGEVRSASVEPNAAPVFSNPSNFLAARAPDAPAFHLGLLLVPGFALMSFASVIEPARGANRMSGKALYDWTLFSAHGGEVLSNSGIGLQTQSLAEMRLDNVDMLVVCAATQGELYRDLETEALLRRLRRHGVAVGAVSTGSFLLARAGLLKDRRCTVHWDYLESFQEAFPDFKLCDDLFVIDDGVVTCAGATAALDLMLQMIRAHQGADLARSIAQQFLHGAIRASADDQRDMRHRLGIANPVVLRAVGLMEATLEEPVPPHSLAAAVGVSQRQLERLCKRYLGCTPARYHMRLRLERARRMLRQTSLSIAEVAVACGFVALSHFAKAYRHHFGCRPRDDRRTQ
jgi:transcriptional regulator GlxA family with amidase domain